MREIFNKKLTDEELGDFDIYEIINETEIPIDKHGFRKGTFTITVVWEEE